MSKNKRYKKHTSSFSLKNMKKPNTYRSNRRKGKTRNQKKKSKKKLGNLDVLRSFCIGSFRGKVSL